MSFLNQITDANVLIVGASQGIGLGFVQKFLQDDRIAKIYASYRQRESASELITLESENAEKLTCLQIDITDESQISEAAQKIRSEVNKLNFVINCVGLLHDETIQPEKSLRQINPDNLLRYFKLIVLVLCYLLNIYYRYFVIKNAAFLRVFLLKLVVLVITNLVDGMAIEHPRLHSICLCEQWRLSMVETARKL
jgi:NAD(P)-dependent dehydrogenase (short-subunit alcohol dehydrogenase family)